MFDKIFEKYLNIIFGVKFGKNCRISRKSSFTCLYGIVKFGDNCVVEPYARIKAVQNIHDRQTVINIDSNVFVGYCTIIDGGNYIEIGQNSMIGPHVFITDSDHKLERRDVPIGLQGGYYGTTLIGQNVWIGASAQVLRGGEIQQNSIVGANSTVMKGMEQESLIVGIPAKEKKRLFL